MRDLVRLLAVHARLLDTQLKTMEMGLETTMVVRAIERVEEAIHFKQVELGKDPCQN